MTPPPPISLDSLRSRFARPGQFDLVDGGGGLTKLVITTPMASAEVYLQGAHVTAYQLTDQPPVLFLSNQSRFAPGKAIRGGIPICFPWFGPLESHDTAPAHGFARTTDWTLVEAAANPDGSAVARFSLECNDRFSPHWPHAFAATYTVTVGPTLTVALEIRHVGGEPFMFEEALHSYFHVADVRRIAVDGLQSTEYIDKTQPGRRTTEGLAPTTIVAETDRVYLESSGTCTITDPTLGRTIQIAKKHSSTTVLWNPWINKSKALPDLGDDEWPHFVCIESANTAQSAIILRPGESHTLTAILTANTI